MIPALVPAQPSLRVREVAPSRWGLPLLAALIALAAWPAQAQFKVVGPDGRVTYTDRQPAPGDGKVTALSSRIGPDGTDDPAFPLELRQAVTRYPVALYTASGACAPCDSARQLLKQRGIPFSEKQVMSSDDAEALERLSGGRDAPTLGIGAQTLRGFAPAVWGSYLDSAGYPRESRLPANYQYPAPSPLTQRREISDARAAPASGESPATVPLNPGNIRF
jgi:glutaredoxin